MSAEPPSPDPISSERVPRVGAPPLRPRWFWARRWLWEVGFWVAMTLFNGAANSTTVLMDVRRVGLDFADWEPAA